jgi:hypothetical protein
MSLPRIIVVRGDGLSSRAIEGFGGGRWSHMANVLGDGTVWDARDDWVKHEGVTYAKGVQRRSMNYLLEQYKTWAIFEAPKGLEKSYEPWVAALRSQSGKPYDQAGIMDFVKGMFTGKYEDYNYAPAAPDESKAWFCDELAVWAATRAGLLPPIPISIYTLTPGSALNLFLGAGWCLVDYRGKL